MCPMHALVGALFAVIKPASGDLINLPFITAGRSLAELSCLLAATVTS